jgi:hypothetical protein
MRIPDILTIPLVILGCNIQMAVISMKFPYLGALKIKSVKDINVTEKDKESRPKYFRGSNHEIHYGPDNKIIIDGDCRNNCTFRICINKDTEQIFNNYNLEELLSNPDYGSGIIGVMILGIPGVILSSPIWIPLQVFYKSFETICGMSFQKYILYLRLKNQLKPEIASYLRTALMKY